MATLHLSPISARTPSPPLPKRRSTSRSSTPRAAPTRPASARTRSPASGSSPARARSRQRPRARAVYFARPVLRMILKQPLDIVNRDDQYDIIVTVAGGGLSGQAGAVRHGSPRPDLFRARPARAAQEGWLPDPRHARRRAQEVRQGEGPPQLPVLEALRSRELRTIQRPRLRATLCTKQRDRCRRLVFFNAGAIARAGISFAMSRFFRHITVEPFHRQGFSFSSFAFWCRLPICL